MKTLPEYITLLQSYMQQNASKYGILRMGIFGSVARNEHTDVSDVDVYVEGQLHGFFALAGIKQDLEELLGCKVDIVRLRDKMDSFLREKILRRAFMYDTLIAYHTLELIRDSFLLSDSGMMKFIVFAMRIFYSCTK